METGAEMGDGASKPQRSPAVTGCGVGWQPPAEPPAELSEDSGLWTVSTCTLLSPKPPACGSLSWQPQKLVHPQPASPKGVCSPLLTSRTGHGCSGSRDRRTGSSRKCIRSGRVRVRAARELRALRVADTAPRAPWEQPGSQRPPLCLSDRAGPCSERPHGARLTEIVCPTRIRC